MYLTKKEVAEAFGVTQLTVDNWMNKGRLTRVYKDARVLTRKEDVLEEIKRQKAEAEDKLDTLKRAIRNLELDSLL